MELAVRQFYHYALRLILQSIVPLTHSGLTDRLREKSHHLIPRKAPSSECKKDQCFLDPAV